jgi:uncharacterized protein YycO
MASITLQFVEGTGLGSGMIKWFGHGLYSHVDCVLPDGTLLGARSDVMSGAPAGVQIRPAGYVNSDKVRCVHLPATDEQSDRFYDFMKAQIGKPYNKIGIFAFAVNASWTSVGAWFCSQVVTAALQASGWLKDLSEPPNKIDPDDLVLILSAFIDIGQDRSSA